MDSPVIENVSDTAFWIAHHRAVETQRVDSLFKDPLAQRLAGTKGQRISEKIHRHFLTGWSVAIRTRVIDDYIARAVGQGIDTILNLGAGLDTRPYRMSLPASLRWMEVDYAGVMEYKENLLGNEKPHCRLERLKADLSVREEREKIFSHLPPSPGKVLVLTEGVVPYLEMNTAGDLARELRNLEQVHSWIIDYFSPATYRFRKRQAIRRQMKKAPFQFEPKDWFGFFQERGWSVGEIRYLVEEGEKLQRPIPLQGWWRWMIKIRAFLASEKQRREYKKWVGYALLVPRSPAGSS